MSQHGVDAVLFELVAVEAQLRVDRQGTQNTAAQPTALNGILVLREKIEKKEEEKRNQQKMSEQRMRA